MARNELKVETGPGRVMPDRLNFFEPWERLPPTHENQLTRALLVVLRCCPIAQHAWLSRIDETLGLHSLPRPTFDTQRGRILGEARERLHDEPIKGISVLCAADVANEDPAIVLESDRGQVLDGIVRYGDDVVIVLESKLNGFADDRQARNINLRGQPVVFEGPVRRILWRDILAEFTDLAHEGRGLVSGAERMILMDFLSFVGTNFPDLGPFDNLERCDAKEGLVARRLANLLNEILGGDGELIPGTPACVTTAYLRYDGEKKEVTLRMYPADTLQQARALYHEPRKAEALLKLQDINWNVRPNFHFGFMAKGFCWTKTTMPLQNYVEHWGEHIQEASQIERHNWNGYWKKLLGLRIAEPADKTDFDRAFTNSAGRHSATPRPGLSCSISWALDEAERLDVRGHFAETVRQHINQVLIALEEEPIPSPTKSA